MERENKMTANLACLHLSWSARCEASICLTSSTRPYCTSSLTSSMPGRYVRFSRRVWASFMHGSLSLIAFSRPSMSSSSWAISFSVLKKYVLINFVGRFFLLLLKFNLHFSSAIWAHQAPARSRVCVCAWQTRWHFAEIQGWLRLELSCTWCSLSIVSTIPFPHQICLCCIC